MTLKLSRSEWKCVTLGQVATASKEKVDPGDGSVERFVAGEHMDSDDLKIHRWGNIGEVDLGPAFHRRFHPGQVLYGSRRTYLRKVAVADFDGVCANTTFVAETKDPNILLQDFLPFIMTSQGFQAFAIAESKGSVNPYVNWSDLERFEFNLPPVDVQERLAGLLWAVEWQARSSADVRMQTSAVRSLWFETALRTGKTTKGWDVRPVTDVVTAGPTNGKSVTANDEARGVPTLSISAIRDGKVLGGKAVKYIDVPPADVANFVIEPDDFLVVRGNGNKQLTGRGGLAVGGLPDGCVYPDLLIRLRFDPALILPEFGAAQWNSAWAHNALIKKAKSTNGIWKINGKDIRSHQLIVPPIDDQRKLLLKLETLDNAIDLLDLESSALAVLRASLLSEIFGGQS
ncbi:hypothetical protein [Antrihabitans spumae]|uniref:Restriction endonuclease subunit S n=1 Tax=Antrihabitans spumae TaxID=3373370 RepID=A0ABW7KC22_9NOCA